MAHKTTVILIDDLDGSQAEETVHFALDGKVYEIDLSAQNAGAMRVALEPFVTASRKAAGPRRGMREPTAGPSAEEVRSWARRTKLRVSERGRISADVRAAYAAVN